jgi:hypothetical protein
MWKSVKATRTHGTAGGPQSFEGVLRSQHRVYDGRGEVARTQDVWGAEGIGGRVPYAFWGLPAFAFALHGWQRMMVLFFRK